MMKLIDNIPLVGNALRLVRSRIRNISGARRISNLKRSQKPIKLVVGSSGVFDEGWEATDIGYLNLLNSEHWKRLDRDSVDAILAEHVWEHLSLSDGLQAAKQCFDYLKPGGYLRLAVPDGFHPSKQYIDAVKPGGNGWGADDHKVLYTHDTLADLLRKAGFTPKLLEYFDEAGQFHFVDWRTTDGTVHRSRRFDHRNADGSLTYTSLIIDAIKGSDQGPSTVN